MVFVKPMYVCLFFYSYFTVSSSALSNLGVRVPFSLSQIPIFLHRLVYKCLSQALFKQWHF